MIRLLVSMISQLVKATTIAACVVVSYVTDVSDARTNTGSSA